MRVCWCSERHPINPPEVEKLSMHALRMPTSTLTSSTVLSINSHLKANILHLCLLDSGQQCARLQYSRIQFSVARSCQIVYSIQLFSHQQYKMVAEICLMKPRVFHCHNLHTAHPHTLTRKLSHTTVDRRQYRAWMGLN